MLRYPYQEMCPSQHKKKKKKKKKFKRLNLTRHVSHPLLLIYEQETV